MSKIRLAIAIEDSQKKKTNPENNSLQTFSVCLTRGGTLCPKPGSSLAEAITTDTTSKTQWTVVAHKRPCRKGCKNQAAGTDTQIHIQTKPNKGSKDHWNADGTTGTREGRPCRPQKHYQPSQTPQQPERRVNLLCPPWKMLPRSRRLKSQHHRHNT